MNQDKDLAHLLNEPRPQEGNGQATDENKNGPKIEKQSRKVSCTFIVYSPLVTCPL